MTHAQHFDGPDCVTCGLAEGFIGWVGVTLCGDERASYGQIVDALHRLQDAAKAAQLQKGANK